MTKSEKIKLFYHTVAVEKIFRDEYGQESASSFLDLIFPDILVEI